ncbi:LANO_0E03774g1_1 [Lachancea nothofagi CBS 11611]|uniref:U2 small nuclear ribonucleoprotein A' n=1 Tax=Lachancea nothofagi CBS 11611 TaxID=1266666 RepID=A0A1G4JRD7_9SACH|nr:LANO_0E03774g1_1 [Lachancea nothofagi CBS 11611]
MKFTPGAVIEAPKYYHNYFDGVHDTDLCVIMRDLQLENDADAMPAVLATLPDATHTLDLTNNELSAIPDLRNQANIETLLLSRNRIFQIDGRFLPYKIRRLTLASNGISNLADLDGLRSSPSYLQNLNLRGNSVCYLENYRLYVISLAPQLKVLDFTKISEEEHREAHSFKLRNAHQAHHEASNNGHPQQSRAKDKEAEVMSIVVNKMDSGVRENLKKQLASATTLEEMERIEKLLSGGV